MCVVLSAGVCVEVWGWGLRNDYKIDCHPKKVLLHEMPGCLSYTSLDLGELTLYVLSSGVMDADNNDHPNGNFMNTDTIELNDYWSIPSVKG